MNPYDKKNSVPNFWLSCIVIDEQAMCRQVREERDAAYIHCAGKTCPTEILKALATFNIEGRPIWKPMHLQPIYRNHVFVTRDGSKSGLSNAYIDRKEKNDTGTDIFQRGLCLPSDNKMTEQEQDVVIEIIHRCFE